jgi:hypothetical protein
VAVEREDDAGIAGAGAASSCAVDASFGAVAEANSTEPQQQEMSQRGQQQSTASTRMKTSDDDEVEAFRRMALVDDSLDREASTYSGRYLVEANGLGKRMKK